VLDKLGTWTYSNLLLQDEHEDARQRLRDALDSDAHRLEEVTFNVFG
jgi:hypothetical protein